MSDASHEIRFTIDSEVARQLLEDLADPDKDLYKRLSSGDREEVAAALAAEPYNIYLSEDAIPPEIELPPQEEIQERLSDFHRGVRSFEPHVGFSLVGFRPPPHALGYVFGVAADLAQPPESSAS